MIGNIKKFLISPLGLSTFLHLFIFIVGLISWPFVSPIDSTAQPLTFINLVERVPQTNLESAASIAPPSPEPTQEETRPKPPPPPPPRPAAVAPALQSARPKPPIAEQVEILPTKKITPTQDKPVASPTTRPPQPKIVNTATPISRPNKLARQSRQKQKAEALQGVLQNLAKATNAKEAEERKKARRQQEHAAKTDRISASIGEAIKTPTSTANAPLGQSDIDRLRTHIARCWVPPVGAKGADKLKVYIALSLEPDGHVREANIVNTTRYYSDNLYRIAANSALRAVLDCQPLPLPADKYNQWKKSEFGFDPKFMKQG